MSELLTIDEALERVLEHVPAPSGRERADRRRRSDVSLREPARRCRRPAAVSELRDGRLRRARGGDAGPSSRSPTASRLAARRPGRYPPGAAAGIATGGTVPDGADAVVPVELRRGSRRARRRPARGDCRSARPATRRRRQGGRRRRSSGHATRRRCRSERWVRPVSQRSSARRGHESRSSRRGTSFGTPGESLEAGQIYESNRRDDRRRAGELGRRDQRAARRCRRRRIASRRNRSRARARRSGDLGRGLDGAARPRAARRCRARRRGGLLGSRDQAREAACLRRSRRHARVRASREPRVVARRSAASSCVPRFSRGRVSRARSRATSAGASRRRFGEIRTATSSCARRRIELADGVDLEPIIGQESHMIVRAAAADALIHVPRGEGEIAAGRDGAVPRLSTSGAARAQSAAAAAARLRPRTAHSDRTRGPRPGRPTRTRQARRAPAPSET